MVKDKPKSLAASKRNAWTMHRIATRLNIILFCVAFLVPVLAFGTWWFVVQYVYFNFHAIIPGQAYRSAQPSPAFLQKVVDDEHIRSIIKFNREVESDWSQEEPTEAKRLDVELFYIPVGVSELPGRPDMIRIIHAIDAAPRPVLVHCKTGADRTGLAAVLIAMKNGVPFQQARDAELRFRFLHVGHFGDDVDDILDQYVEDRTAEGKSVRTYADFRQYILDEYYPGFYHAGIAPEQTTLTGRPGETVTFHVRVTDLSRRPWLGGFFTPFRLNLGIPGTGSGHYPDILADAIIGRHLDSGQSVMINLPIKIPDLPPGLHRYVLDIGQKHRLTFSHFGSPTVNVYLNVQSGFPTSTRSLK
jgi:protein tyrosine phosphatase (PTP) superfamily phosphohydrolase (DUF442 family)